MPAMQPVETIEELLALPDDGQRHELLDGVHVVTPAPAARHQLILGELFGALSRALDGHPVLRVLTSPADIVLGPRTLVQPDLFVCRLPATGFDSTWTELGTPLLAIEILSPSTAPRDRGAKRRIYLRAGVAEYWIVDPDARLVERWTPDDPRPEIVDEVLEWRVEGAALLRLPVARLFGEPAGG